MLQCLKLLVPVICFFACNSQQPIKSEDTASVAINTIPSQPAKDSIVKGAIVEKVICKNDASQSYAVYIPVGQHNLPAPVIYFFDPHSDGSLPVKNYRSLADKHHFILIGSNNSKNGNDWNTTQQIWSNLLADSKSRLMIDTNRIYTCGFSGGAKVAGFIALHQNNIRGVIAAGAGLPENEPAGNFPFSFTGMAGTGDMNMTDVIALNDKLDNTTTIHRIILFDGKHAWPPVSCMEIAFEGFELDAMRQKMINKNDSLIKAFVAEMNRRVDDNIAAKKWVEAQQASTLAIEMLNGLTSSTNDFKQKERVIIANPVYKQQLHTAQQFFAIEQNKKQTFQQQFEQGDMQYWTTTINDLLVKAKEPTAEGAMYQRLLAYLSLAFYSISNNLIQNNQNEAAQYFVTLYKMADAGNSEAWYFSALINARKNNAKATEADLLKAAELGFTDTSRMLQQPEFQVLSPQINYTIVESRMKRMK